MGSNNRSVLFLGDEWALLGFPASGVICRRGFSGASPGCVSCAPGKSCGGILQGDILPLHFSPRIDVRMVEMEGQSSGVDIEAQLSNRILTAGSRPKGSLRPLVSG